MKNRMKSDISLEQNLEKLTKILICPKTGSKLKYDKKNNEFISLEAKLAYPIQNNIPILIVNKARKLKSDN